MTPAKLLTNRFLVRCGELWPDTVRLEETGVGDGTPTAYVNQAIAAERERCAKIIETDGLHLAGDQEEERQADIVALAAKIRSGE